MLGPPSGTPRTRPPVPGTALASLLPVPTSSLHSSEGPLPQRTPKKPFHLNLHLQGGLPETRPKAGRMLLWRLRRHSMSTGTSVSPRSSSSPTQLSSAVSASATRGEAPGPPPPVLPARGAPTLPLPVSQRGGCMRGGLKGPCGPEMTHAVSSDMGFKRWEGVRIQIQHSNQSEDTKSAVLRVMTLFWRRMKPIGFKNHPADPSWVRRLVSKRSVGGKNPISPLGLQDSHQ